VRLVLWDIDGTLVNTAGHGRDAFMEAFEAVMGRPPDYEDVPMAGRTDHAITLDLLARNGVEDGEELLPRMFEALHAALLDRRDLMAAEGAPQPGVPEALTALRAREDVLQSLLTGNIEPNAELKLAAFDLHLLVDLAIGGYGSDHGTRSELVGVARRKAKEMHGVDVALSETVVVGDTPLDVDAARAAGARAVGVASGPYTAEELQQAAPDAVLEDVRDIDALLGALDLPKD
jgi:phosphoglycolate phosphatase-like HAD superfamily hydrolase